MTKRKWRNQRGLEGDRKRSTETELLSGSVNDLSKRRQVLAEHRNSPRPPAPVPLNATLMLITSAATNLLAQHCKAKLIQLAATLSGHRKWNLSEWTHEIHGLPL